MNAPPPGGTFRVLEGNYAIRPGGRTILKRCEGCPTVVAWAYRLAQSSPALVVHPLCSACEERARKEPAR